MQNYNRQNAVAYAYAWWNKRNPKYYNFDGIGGDCTNFISQCLCAGGYKMSHNKTGWYYYSPSSRSPSWTGVEEFFNFLTKNTHDLGPRAKVVGIDQIEVGDVVQLSQNSGRFHHTLLITKILGAKTLDNILITCHTRDFVNKRLSDYKITKMRFLKLY